MSGKLPVALIGFGEVGQIIGADLLKSGACRVSAWDLEFERADSAQAKTARHLEIASASARDAVANASLVLCAVTAAQDIAAARSVAPHLAPGALFVDLNSVSPQTRRQVADEIHAGAGRYLEAAIMAPFAPGRCASPILLGGPHAREFAVLAPGLGFTDTQVFSDTVGKASAAKMCRSVLVKGLESLLTESLLSARRHGVEESVIESLQSLLPAQDWNHLSRYMISRSLQHGARRAEEMREAASTVTEAGLDPWMSAACAKRQDWAARFAPHAQCDSLPAMLDAILAAIPTEHPSPC
ncbi:MAG: DUF1932 domain-containing protein [Pseudomonadota bacterium]